MLDALDVDSWPAWQTEITAAHIDGLLEPGASFDWTSYGFSVTSTVYDLVENACFGAERPAESQAFTSGCSPRHLTAYG